MPIPFLSRGKKKEQAKAPQRPMLPPDQLAIAVNTADENTIRTYFATHTGEWAELQGIASPLRSLRQSCPQQVSPADVARLYDAMAS